MDPLYTTHNTTPAYQLNWGLTLFWRAAPIAEERWFADLKNATESDGVRVIKHQTATNDASQFFVSTKPNIAPAKLLWSVKGRLQHVVKKAAPKAFRRNYSLRSIGSAKRSVVEEYVTSQLGHHRMADPDVQRKLEQFQKTYPGVDLGKPRFSSHGQYWYNLHVVIVNNARWTEIRDDVLSRLSDMIVGVASKHDYRLSRVSLLADHIHMTMGCPIDRSPEDAALSYMNNCAFACGMKEVFQHSNYVGTIGEYDRGAV